jgi:tRNA/tmRNA/rRNA uracil-C5-methylase (TrmA/RlmC/RlmD family)
MSPPEAALPAGCEPACHACPHRTLAAASSVAQKRSYLARALAPWAQLLEPVAQPAARWGYRRKVSLNARWDEAHGWRFGLVRRVAREELFIPIPRCPVQAPEVNALLALLATALPPAPAFPLAFVVVSGAQATLIVKAHAVDTGWLPALATRLARGDAPGTEGLWLHRHPSAGRRLFARSGWTLLWGEPRSRDARGLAHGPTAFAQAIPELHARALDRAQAFLAPGPADAVVDLCSGVGSTLQRWRAAGAAALGVELSGEAVECAERNAPGARLLRGTTAQRLPQLVAFQRERRATGGAAPLVYANPPRSGLEPEVLGWLAELAPPRLAYLSCSAGTLARDLAALEAAGQRVVALAPFDFFPQTQHVEVLALLER